MIRLRIFFLIASIPSCSNNMKAYVACIPCYFRQALSSTEAVTKDAALQIKVLNEIARIVPKLDQNASPAHNSTIVLRAANRILGVSDPYAEAKRHYNKLALKMLPTLRKMVKEAENRILMAAKLAVVGNVIDLGIRAEINIEATIDQVLGKGFAVDHTGRFLRMLDRPRSVLYLVDNAGEIVFDRLLIETLIDAGNTVTVGVKSGPILNDCSMEDAEQVGLTEITEVIETGSDWVGTDLATCSENFKKHFKDAYITVAKGQGNFETLGGARKRLFFVLKAKCECVAQELGVKMGDLVFVGE